MKPITFLKEVQVELSKVTWLTRVQTLRYSVLVITISILVAIFLGTLDYFFGGVIERFILNR